MIINKEKTKQLLNFVHEFAEIPETSRRRSCSRYRKIFPAWKNVKYQYGQGAKCSGTNTGVFHSQACTFPEESFILSSPCNSVYKSNGYEKCTQRSSKPYLGVEKGSTIKAWIKEYKITPILNMYKDVCVDMHPRPGCC